jgi:hypothetical protein
MKAAHPDPQVRYQSMQGLKADLEKIYLVKTGYERCVSCGTPFLEGHSFCAACGALKKKDLGDIEERNALTFELFLLNAMYYYVPVIRNGLEVSRNGKTFPLACDFDLFAGKYEDLFCPRCAHNVNEIHCCPDHGLHCASELWRCASCNAEKCTTCSLFTCSDPSCRKSLCRSCYITCRNCSKVQCRGHARICRGCEKIGCSCCIMTSGLEGIPLCSTCITSCQSCRRTFKRENSRKCQICGEESCPQCLSGPCTFWNCSRAELCSRHSVACALCGKTLCTEHSLGCSECSKPLCLEHRTLCTVCGRIFCAEHILECSQCRTRQCRQCASGGFSNCHECGAVLCEEHRSPCRLCGKATCQNHKGSCPSCALKSCPDHFRECALCNKHLCEPCAAKEMKVCSLDGNLLCDGCAAHCSTCGETLCKTHTQECTICRAHSCLQHYRSCEFCGTESCGLCQVQCTRCGKIACQDHATRCPSCERSECESHYEQCSECGVEVCVDCLEARHGKCPACRKMAREDPAGDPVQSLLEIHGPSHQELKGISRWSHGEVGKYQVFKGSTFSHDFFYVLEKANPSRLLSSRKVNLAEKIIGFLGFRRRPR